MTIKRIPCEQPTCEDKWTNRLTLCWCHKMVCDTCLERSDHQTHRTTTWQIKYGKRLPKEN